MLHLSPEEMEIIMLIFEHAHMMLHQVSDLDCTSFQGHKWPQTKMHTNFDIIFGHSALSHGVIYFVPRVSSKNLEMEVSDWLLKNFNQ